MPAGLGPRFVIEAGFLIAVAVVAGLARLGALMIILVMAGAWLLVAAVEWRISYARGRTAPEPMDAAAEPLEQRREPPAVRTVAPAAVAVPAAPSPVAERTVPEPAPAPEPEVTPGPSPEPAPEPEPETPPEPAPPETPPEQPRIAAVAPVPEPPAEPAPARTPVVAFTPRTLGVPQQWNLWELERVARERSGVDAIRDEERSFLLMYLREFAGADGVLPTPFDGIVREAFGDVLDAVGA